MKNLRKKRSSRTTRSSKRPKSSAKRSRPRKKKSTERRTTTAYLGLGSNLGDRRANLTSAIAELARLGPLRRVSSFFRTDPVGFTDQPDFWNAVVAIGWNGTPARLLASVKAIERRLGRKRTFRYGPRSIDIDLLDLGGRVRASPDPVLPHPRMTGRRFVLAPLAEIAPSWRHPIEGLSAAELLGRLPREPSARRISGKL